MITKANLVKHELIGLEVEILDSPQAELVGTRGRVVDETMQTLVIEHDEGERRVPKAGTRFRFDVNGGVVVDGDRIAHRPEDRTKKAR